MHKNQKYTIEVDDFSSDSETIEAIITKASKSIKFTLKLIQTNALLSLETSHDQKVRLFEALAIHKDPKITAYINSIIGFKKFAKINDILFIHPEKSEEASEYLSDLEFTIDSSSQHAEEESSSVEEITDTSMNLQSSIIQMDERDKKLDIIQKKIVAEKNHTLKEIENNANYMELKTITMNIEHDHEFIKLAESERFERNNLLNRLLDQYSLACYLIGNIYIHNLIPQINNSNNSIIFKNYVNLIEHYCNYFHNTLDSCLHLNINFYYSSNLLKAYIITINILNDLYTSLPELKNLTFEVNMLLEIQPKDNKNLFLESDESLECMKRDILKTIHKLLCDERFSAIEQAFIQPEDFTTLINLNKIMIEVWLKISKIKTLQRKYSSLTFYNKISVFTSLLSKSLEINFHFSLKPGYLLKDVNTSNFSEEVIYRLGSLQSKRPINPHVSVDLLVCFC